VCIASILGQRSYKNHYSFYETWMGNIHVVKINLTFYTCDIFSYVAIEIMACRYFIG
jgi:hypothetical protein